MRNIVSEIQQYCFEMDMDVEYVSDLFLSNICSRCTTYIPESERHLAEFSFLIDLIREPQTTIIVSLNFRYSNN